MAAVAAVGAFDTAHGDMVHDTSFDYYGTRMATASSDRLVKVFDVAPGENGQTTHVADLNGHDGPVWQVSWAHPKFGSVLASCSFDRKVIVWKESESARGQFSQVFSHTHHGSVNAVAFAPHEFGLVLACGSSDGSASVLTYKPAENVWDVQTIPDAHSIGCTSVSFAPAVPAGAVLAGAGDPPAPSPRLTLATGGCDNTAKVWLRDDATGTWQCDATLRMHADWVRDVAFCPNGTLPVKQLATAGQDGQVVLWTKGGGGGGGAAADADANGWTGTSLHNFAPQPVWRVSWSLSGNVLAATDGSGAVSLWKEEADGAWVRAADVAASA